MLTGILNYSLPLAPLVCALIRIEEISGYGAVYPGRIMRGVISITTGDIRKGCLGQFFVFSVCMYVCVFGGDEVEC